MAFDDDVATVATATVARPTAAPVSFLAAVDPCSTVGVSSLPHRDAAAAAEFSLASFDIATLPSLPRRSPAESPVAQALVGATGVTLGQYGTVAVDVRRLDPGAVVCTDLWRDSFTGLRTCLELAVERGHTGPIKWHFVGPISVGLALKRAGADADVAFSMAAHVVRSHLEALAALIATSLPGSPQLVVLDEPFLDDLMSRDFPIAPEEAVDLLSSAMAAVEHRATVGVHACCKVDIATLMASGPEGAVVAGPPGPGALRRLPRTLPAQRRLDHVGRGPDRRPDRIVARSRRRPTRSAVARTRTARLRPGPPAGAEPALPALRPRRPLDVGRRAGVHDAARRLSCRPARVSTSAAQDSSGEVASLLFVPLVSSIF